MLEAVLAEGVRDTRGHGGHVPDVHVVVGAGRHLEVQQHALHGHPGLGLLSRQKIDQNLGWNFGKLIFILKTISTIYYVKYT